MFSVRTNQPGLSFWLGGWKGKGGELVDYILNDLKNCVLFVIFSKGNIRQEKDTREVVHCFVLFFNYREHRKQFMG